MKFTPQALRFVSGNMSDMPDQALPDWQDNHASENLSAGLSSRVLEALSRFAKSLEHQIDSGSLSEDGEADAVNDLGFANATAASLIREGAGSVAAE